MRGEHTISVSDLSGQYETRLASSSGGGCRKRLSVITTIQVDGTLVPCFRVERGEMVKDFVLLHEAVEFYNFGGKS